MPDTLYEIGDCVVEEIGFFKLSDGREVHGVVLTFPGGPPPLPTSIVFERTPLRLSLKTDPINSGP